MESIFHHSMTYPCVQMKLRYRILMFLVSLVRVTVLIPASLGGALWQCMVISQSSTAQCVSALYRVKGLSLWEEWSLPCQQCHFKLFNTLDCSDILCVKLYMINHSHGFTFFVFFLEIWLLIWFFTYLLLFS